MFEQVWLWALLLSLCISLVIAWKTYPKGKQVNLSLIGTAIGQTLGRSFAFFAIICLPLVNQPRISSAIALPVAGMILVLCGITLVLVATRELTKTKFREWKGIPSKLITTGPYRVIRHPANVGFISIFVGWSLTWGALYCLCLIAPILIIGLVIESFWEERNLEKEFGNEYKEYKKKVGMFFPKIRRRK